MALRVVGVTGGAGFIGRYVVESLVSQGYEVIIFDHKERNIDYGPNVETMLGDVRDEVAVTELAAHVDGIIHLAAVLGTQETIKNPTPAVLSNIQGGLNFLEAITQYDLAGAYIAVGNHWMNNPYSISKTCIERFCFMYAKERNTRINTVRAVNAFGPRQAVAEPFGPGKVRKITPAFICRALSNMPIEVYGDGNQVSDMVYVGDVANALIHALEQADKGNVYPFTIECGPSDSMTVNEFANIIANEASLHTGHVAPVVHLPMRPGEIPGDRVTADTTTLIRTGIDPTKFKDLQDAVKETVQYFFEQKGHSWHPPLQQ